MDIAVSVAAIAQRGEQKHVGAAADPAWGRRVSRAEYETVCEAVDRLGFDEGWVQEFGGDVAPELVGYQMQAGDARAPR